MFDAGLGTLINGLSVLISEISVHTLFIMVGLPRPWVIKTTSNYQLPWGTHIGTHIVHYGRVASAIMNLGLPRPRIYTGTHIVHYGRVASARDNYETTNQNKFELRLVMLRKRHNLQSK